MGLRIFLLLILPLCSAMTHLASAAETDGLIAEPSLYDFGTIEQGELAIARFKIQNASSATAIIQWMEFSEQGLIAQVSPRIAAGSSVDVLVNWDTSNFEGLIEGEVALGFQHPDLQNMILKVTGTVIPIDKKIQD